jgi:hypothetical protein
MGVFINKKSLKKFDDAALFPIFLYGILMINSEKCVDQQRVYHGSFLRLKYFYSLDVYRSNLFIFSHTADETSKS